MSFKKEILFVDGYNVINYWEDLKNKAKRDLEDARNSLIEVMVEYHHSTNIEVIVVFDAHMVKNNIGEKELYKGILIVYTKENETADHYIEREIDKLDTKNNFVRVATSDWLEQQIVLSRGATRISSRELQYEVRKNKNIINKEVENIDKNADIFMNKLDQKSIDKLKKFKP